MSVRIVYKDFAIGADENAVMSATGQAEASVLALLPFGDENRTPYTTLEQNMWALDGKRVFYDGAGFAFWSKDLSGADCTFTTPPEIVATLGKQYTSKGIFLDFGTLNYCSEIEIEWLRNGTTLQTTTFYPDATEYFCDELIEDYDEVRLRLVKTKHPRQRARLNGLYFGISRSYGREILRKVRITQEINLISKEMPANVLDWNLYSVDSVEFMFQAKQPVEVYDNDKLLGVFYIKSSNRKSKKLYEISCTDAIGVLDERPFPDSVYNGKNAYDLAIEICGDFAVEMDEALKTKTVSGILKGKSCRQALQQLCFAIGAVADTSGMEGIKIFEPKFAEPSEIPMDRMRVGNRLSKRDIATEINLTSHSYSTSGEGSAIDINGVMYYDTPIEYTLQNPNVRGEDKKNVISVKDATLVSSANVAEIANRMLQFYQRRNTLKGKFRVVDERVGDYVTAPTNWGEWITGNYVRGSITLSGIVVADAEIVGG